MGGERKDAKVGVCESCQEEDVFGMQSSLSLSLSHSHSLFSLETRSSRLSSLAGLVDFFFVGSEDRSADFPILFY